MKVEEECQQWRRMVVFFECSTENCEINQHIPSLPPSPPLKNSTLCIWGEKVKKVIDLISIVTRGEAEGDKHKI